MQKKNPVRRALATIRSALTSTARFVRPVVIPVLDLARIAAPATDRGRSRFEGSGALRHAPPPSPPPTPEHRATWRTKPRENQEHSRDPKALPPQGFLCENSPP